MRPGVVSLVCGSECGREAIATNRSPLASFPAGIVDRVDALIDGLKRRGVVPAPSR